MPGHDWWGAPQWAAWLEHKELPIKAATKAALTQLEEGGEENLTGQEYAALLLDDPLLALRLLHDANRRLPRRMARDITTPLGIVLALGTEQFKRHIHVAPEVAGGNQGFSDIERRASLAARIASAWGSLHHDLDSGELALAALLADAGEIELWAFIPELPQKALDELQASRASRSDQAQRQACGFAFRDLSLELIERGGLPQLLKQLIRGDEGMRARIARLAVDAGRHLSYGAGDPALPHDIVAAGKLTQASLATVVHGLPGLGEDERDALLLSATQLSESVQK
jgi:hypothetical protein